MAKKILLIEYEPRYLDRVRGYLAGKDFDLVVAKDGEEGLEAYRRGKPDVVLISSVLPKLRTPDVIRGMQETGGAPPILLMMTGYKGKNRKADAQRVGATNILEKPFTEEALVAEIDAAVSGSSSHSTGSVPVLDPNAPLLSSDDIFSDVLSGMDDEPAAPKAPVTGTDPGIQRKLEETLSGILPAPRRSATAAAAAPPAARPAPASAKTGPVPGVAAVKAAASGAAPTMRVPAVEPAAPAAPAPAPAAAPVPRPPLRVDSAVDRMLTETLSGLRSSSAKPAEKPKPAPAPPPPAPAAEPEIGFDRTERLDPQKIREVMAAPVPKPAPAPAAPAPRPVPAPQPAPEAPRPAPAGSGGERGAQAPGEQRRPASTTGVTGVTGATSAPGSFGRYQLLEKIAAGGMAEVFKARMRGEEGFEKIVAIKRILPHMADNDDFITMFIDEAKLAAQLTHNNIIHIYDLGKVDAYHYIAMEYVEGKDLRSILKLGQERGYPLPVELALFVASKIANALDYAHRRMGMDGQELNLVHRDVSPQNILISFEGDIKLCDFGIAKAATKVSQTQTGALKGKLQYMSPEQAWGKKIDRRSDIFSLGIVLFEMLTGERLFTGDTDLTILEQVRDARVVAPSTKNSEIPKKVDQIVLKALAKNPQDRYQNASEMEKEINAVLYSYQPTPGPADLAIYMHRLMESQPVVSDEQIDAAFAHAAAAPAPEPAAKKGKGLVISKKAPAPAPGPPPPVAPPPAERSTEVPAPREVSAPALSLGHEPPRSRTGLYAAIGIAVVVLVVAGILLTRKKAGPAATVAAVATPVPSTATAPAPDATAPSTAAPGTATAEPTKVIDQKAFEAELARRKAEMERQMREAAAKGATPVPGKPLVQPTAAAGAPSLAPSKPLEPPRVAEQPTAVPPTPVPVRPTEPPKVAEVAPPKAAPAPVESAPAPAPAPAASEQIKEGDLVGPGEGVNEPKLLGAFVITGLPPQARNVTVQRGSNGLLGSPSILALINENGTVTETRVLKPSSYKFVDDAAVNALKNARFTPATKNGVKVKMWKAFVVPVKR